MNTAPRDVQDTFGRPLKSLRLSVTDRCNLRCKYCMPEEEYAWLPRDNVLTFEEMTAVTGYFTDLGVDKVRLTGGEPLLRRDLPRLVRLLFQNRKITDLALTTNGILLGDQAQDLYDAGVHRITVSLDTLRPDRFRALTRRDEHVRVLEGIQAVLRVGFTGLKLDTVAIRGFNDDELTDLIEFGKRVRAEVRFIEYMDVGGATDWSMNQVLSRSAILDTLGRRYGRIEPIDEVSTAPAQRFLLPDGTSFLYAKDGTDLRGPLRAGASPDSIRALIRSVWQGRKDRGAEERKALELDGARETQLIEIQKLKDDPHLEMHARGG